MWRAYEASNLLYLATYCAPYLASLSLTRQMTSNSPHYLVRPRGAAQIRSIATHARRLASHPALPSAVCVYRRRIKAAHKVHTSPEQQELEKRIEKRHTVHTSRTAA